MKNSMITPLGEIQVYIDGVLSAYEVEPSVCAVRAVRNRPVAGSYRITVSADDWQTIRCVVSLHDPKIPNTGASGQRYLYAEFAKDTTVLTIGAGDEQTSFTTNRLRYGVEYVRRTPMDTVMFGVAWATDYEGQFDIRTQLATDLY